MTNDKAPNWAFWDVQSGADKKKMLSELFHKCCFKIYLIWPLGERKAVKLWLKKDCSIKPGNEPQMCCSPDTQFWIQSLGWDSSTCMSKAAQYDGDEREAVGVLQFACELEQVSPSPLSFSSFTTRIDTPWPCHNDRTVIRTEEVSNHLTPLKG